MHPLVAVILIAGGALPVLAFTARRRGHWFGLILLFLLGAFAVILLENAYIRLPFLWRMIWEGPDFIPILIALLFALGTIGIISLIIYTKLPPGKMHSDSVVDQQPTSLGSIPDFLGQSQDRDLTSQDSEASK